MEGLEVAACSLKLEGSSKGGKSYFQILDWIEMPDVVGRAHGNVMGEFLIIHSFIYSFIPPKTHISFIKTLHSEVIRKYNFKLFLY